MQLVCKFYFDDVTTYIKCYDAINLKNMVNFCAPTLLVFADLVTYHTFLTYKDNVIIDHDLTNLFIKQMLIIYLAIASSFIITNFKRSVYMVTHVSAKQICIRIFMKLLIV